ncbi:MAG: hypothetical protein IJ379_01785 [Lachnospiraceae bacterium]|nr:hypothetical protein [Lachnospiraceae bacterium]
MDNTPQRICKKCLMRDMQDKAEYFQNLQSYIDNLDPDTKASEELYEERLGICKECELLLEGMCRSCGCYVELRAAIGKNVCPNRKW